MGETILCAVEEVDGHEVTDGFRVTNNPPGAQTAETTPAQLATDLGYIRTEIAWKATEMLRIPLHRQVRRCPQLESFEPELAGLNPQLVTRFREGLVLRSSYPIDPQMDGLVTTTLAVASDHVGFIQRLTKRLDQHIARAIEPVPNPLITAKGLDTADINLGDLWSPPA